jgi:hypothetical protein
MSDPRGNIRGNIAGPSDVSSSESETAASAWQRRPAMGSRSRCGLSDMTSHEPTATTSLDRASETEPAGIDLVFEGLAERITDGPTLEAVAAVWRESGWAAEVSGDGIVAPYNAPGTGPPPWQVYRVAARTVFGVATAEPYGATRWRF